MYPRPRRRIRSRNSGIVSVHNDAPSCLRTPAILLFRLSRSEKLKNPGTTSFKLAMDGETQAKAICVFCASSDGNNLKYAQAAIGSLLFVKAQHPAKQIRCKHRARRSDCQAWLYPCLRWRHLWAHGCYGGRLPQRSVLTSLQMATNATSPSAGGKVHGGECFILPEQVLTHAR